MLLMLYQRLLPVREDAVTLDELRAADEAFLASTTADVMPVVAVDGTSLGDGSPGPVSRRLVDALAARMGRT